MGNYNPHAPYVLGQEWVPIKDENLVFSPVVNTVEYVTGLSLTSATQLNEARFYVNNHIPRPVTEHTAVVSIYQSNVYPDVGPIRQVVIPCNSVSPTGADVLFATPAGLDPYVTSYGGSSPFHVVFDRTAGQPPKINIGFATANYPFLASKRILNVSFLYSGYMEDFDANGPVEFVRTNLGAQMTSVAIVEQASSFSLGMRENAFSNTGVLQVATSINNVARDAFFAITDNQIMDLGDVNAFWNPGVNPSTLPVTAMPWSYNDLLRFEANAAQPQRINILVQNPATAATAIFSNYPKLHLIYAAMKVTYCEETRVAAGSAKFSYGFGSNRVPLYTLNRVANPVLPPGNYLAGLSWVSPGAVNIGGNANTIFPQLKAARQLYEIPSHPSFEVTVPVPINDDSVVERTFTNRSSDVLPQLTLHATGGPPINAVHVYGRQAPGQVYGSFNVTQEVDTLPSDGSAYTWIRFYARRYGTTTVPLTATINGSSSASITSAEFDTLEQLTIDNWREISLQLDTPLILSPSSSVPQIVWTATGEKPGNRWEVLGAAAPAITGLPGTTTTEVVSVRRLGPATYGQPASGSTINMGWLPQLGPYVTGTTDDQSADVSVILSQTPPPVTGLTATWLSQAVTGIGQNCGIDPCCIPSEIYYTQLTWDPTIFGVMDQFGRTESDTWGVPDFGPVYTALLNSTALDVDDGEGLITQPSSGSSPEGAITAINSSSVDIQATLRNISGGAVTAGLYGRRIDATNFYFGAVEVNSATSVTIAVYRTVAGVTTSIASRDITTWSHVTTGAGSAVRMRFLVDQNLLKLKVWAPGTTEPALWSIEATDSNLSSSLAGGAAIFARSLSGSPVTVGVSDLEVTPPKYWFGSYELQRRDTVETDWQTIMKATNPAVNTFNDFEARPGIVSEYRIRRLNVYDFWGDWSPEVSGMVPSPGVYGGCLTPGHLLIFTTNEIQNGSSNLAYSSVWLDQQVEEAFAFPEAGFVQMQAMYDRDFYVAFRPLERGGEQFQRTVLVQAAAIAPETLGDFTSLRNMAWVNVNYVCVRDEDGNRWFAHVGVPSGNVLRNRKLYLAPVQITEVTATPTPVDPSPWF